MCFLTLSKQSIKCFKCTFLGSHSEFIISFVAHRHTCPLLKKCCQILHNDMLRAQFWATFFNYSECHRQVFSSHMFHSERNMKLRQYSKAQLWTNNSSSCQSLPGISVTYRFIADDYRKYELVFCLFNTAGERLTGNRWLDQSVNRCLIVLYQKRPLGGALLPLILVRFGPLLHRPFDEKMG